MRTEVFVLFHYFLCHGVENYFPRLWGISDTIFISHAALAREGDYEMMPVCAGVRVLVCHADFSKTIAVKLFLQICCSATLSYKMVHSLGSQCMP